MIDPVCLTFSAKRRVGIQKIPSIVYKQGVNLGEFGGLALSRFCLQYQDIFVECYSCLSFLEQVQITTKIKKVLVTNGDKYFISTYFN